MGENQVKHILTEILYATLNETENNDSIKQKITPDILKSVYCLAKKHDLAHVVSKFVYRAKIDADQEFQEELQKEEVISFCRYEQMKYVFEEICGAFNEAEIAYIPLKGFVIRPYYPYESMRTSCDIDILVREEDIESAIKLLETKGFRCEERNYHDVSLYSPNNVHLELHFNIQESKDNLDVVLKDAWQYAVPINSTQYEFSKDFFAFYLFAHMAYHFVSGGCGIRSLMDIWVMEHKMGVSYLCAEELLKKAGIYQFASEMSNLAEQCFTHNEINSFYDSILEYIFRGGAYGSLENHIAVDKLKTKNTFSYAIKRLFLPYKSMVVSYRILKKAPYLLPFCWVARWIKAIFGGKSAQIVSEMSYANNISDAQIKEVEDICCRLGL